VVVSDVPPEQHPQHDPEHDPESTRVLPPDQPAEPAKPRFVDRLWSLRAMIAVALASVILGGLGGAALANAGGHDDEGMRFGPGRGPGGFQRGGPMLQPPGMGSRDNRQYPMPRYRGPERWNNGGPNGVLPPNGEPSPAPRVKPTPSD
jgi:hypothetical protein